MVFVKKGTGETVQFDPEKIAGSLRRCGANEQVVKEILQAVETEIYDGMYTKEIYYLAMRLLRKRDKITAAKYTLKEALMRLGDSGYPFEVFIEKLLQREGYTTQRNVVLEGECVSHEVDIIATKNKEVIMVECKHHRSEELMCHIQTALYVYARFLDLKAKFNQVMLATNTLFSKQTLQYGSCRGMLLLGWNYPMNFGLERRIDKYRLYPVTLLRLKAGAIARCLAKEIVLLEDLQKVPVGELTQMLDLSERKVRALLHYVDALCRP